MQVLTYRGPSAGRRRGSASEVALVTALPQPIAFHTAEPQPPPGRFLEGCLPAAGAFAESLLLLARTAATRFFTPPAMVARLIRAADPVITVDSSDLRLESFSPCCGVYARLDLPLGSFEATTLRRGTTNVDVGPELRRWLGGVDRRAALDLRVGEDAFEVADERGSVVERKVELPPRWLIGFLEVQALQRRLAEVHECSGVAAVRALQDMPRAKTKDGISLVPTAAGFRIGRPGGRGAFTFGGQERLQLFDGVARSIRSLRVFADPRHPGRASTTAWIVELEGGSRLTLMLSAERWRGFSGEGQGLKDLTARDPALLSLVRGALAWQGTVDPSAMAMELGHGPGEVEGALAELGAQGLLGYDLDSGRYFHRVLPFVMDDVERRQPRLQAAIELHSQGACRPDPGGDGSAFYVRSGAIEHRVILSDGIEGGGSCTCTWYAKHRGVRGPCKHVLAAALAGVEGGGRP